MLRLVIALALLLGFGVEAEAQITISSFANAASTGTTLNKFAITTGAPSTAVIAGTATTSGVIGIVVGNAGTTGNAIIAISGVVSCVFDNANVAGNWAILSTTVAGDCHDSGTASTSSAPSGAVGISTSTNAGGAGTYSIRLGGPTLPYIAPAGSGTVTTVSVVSANGLAGSVANATTTPAITLSTSITGVLKGNGTAVSAATAGTDYVAPGTATTFTAAQTFAAVQGGTNVQSGTTYSVAATDCGETLIFTSNSAVTVTIPASIAPASGTSCIVGVIQGGTAKVSLNGTAVSAATLVSGHSYTGTSGTQGSVVAFLLTTVSAAATAYLTGDGS